MDIFDSDGSVRHDITEAVDAISRYIEACPYKGIYPPIASDRRKASPESDGGDSAISHQVDPQNSLQ